MQSPTPKDKDLVWQRSQKKWEMISKATKFLSEVKVEVKKVTWPSRKEAIGGTTVVVIVVFLVALFLGIVDALLSKIVQVLIDF